MCEQHFNVVEVEMEQILTILYTVEIFNLLYHIFKIVLWVFFTSVVTIVIKL